MSDSQSNSAVAEARTTKPRKAPPYQVILLDDQEHTYDYVMEMLKQLFGFGRPQAFMMADQVHNKGRAIVLTTTKEHAELKREQIVAFGADPRVADSKGSMSAVIEPVPQ